MTPFERTTCACDACQQCCREQPGPLMPDDVYTIALHLGLTVEQLAERYLCASPGCVVGDKKTGKMFRIGTITPKTKLYSGTCVFLGADSRCTIHEVAPFGCSHFDTHMDRDEAQRRGVWYLRLIASSAEYAKLRTTLAPATSWRPREVLR